MRACECPDDAQIHIGTWGDPYQWLCNCCTESYQNPPPLPERLPWEVPGHQCTCEGENTP